MQTENADSLVYLAYACTLVCMEIIVCAKDTCIFHILSEELLIMVLAIIWEKYVLAL